MIDPKETFSATFPRTINHDNQNLRLNKNSMGFFQNNRLRNQINLTISIPTNSEANFNEKLDTFDIKPIKIEINNQLKEIMNRNISICVANQARYYEKFGIEENGKGEGLKRKRKNNPH
jgi:hypothetical protein